MENTINKSISVGTDPVLVAEELFTPIAERKAFTMVNTSTGGQNITISFGYPTASGAGIFLYTQGSYAESRGDGFLPCTVRIYAIASAAGGTLAYSERVSTADYGGI